MNEEQTHQTIAERAKVNERKETLGYWLKKRMSWFVVVGASALFIFKEVLDLQRTDKDLLTIIMGMALTYLFTIYISISLRKMGKKSGKDSSTYKSALKYLADAKNNVKDILYLLPKFCRHKNEQTLEDVRKFFLEENGLSYELYKKGYYDKPEIAKSLSKDDIDALQEVKEITITKLVPNELLSEHSKSKSKYQDPLYLGRDETTDEKVSSTKMLISKLVLPIITGYFAVNVTLNDGILWGAIQVGIILLLGVTHYMEGEDYITDELKNRQINKADHLIDFRNTYDNQRDLFKTEEEILKELEKPEQQKVAKIDKTLEFEEVQATNN